MNYQRIHDEIISRAKCRARPSGYVEKHHVLPRSMGGSNAKENLVILSAREHYIVHWLLYKIYRNTAMAFAWYRLTHGNKNRRTYVSRTFEYARRARAWAVSGSNHPFYGKRLTDEHRKNLSSAKRGKTYAELGREGASPLLGRKTTETHREKISRAVRGRTYGVESRRSLSAARGSQTGVTGVRRAQNRWQALIYVNGKRLNLGSFKTLDAASAARRAAEEKYLSQKVCAG